MKIKFSKKVHKKTPPFFVCLIKWKMLFNATNLSRNSIGAFQMRLHRKNVNYFTVHFEERTEKKLSCFESKHT